MMQVTSHILFKKSFETLKKTLQNPSRFSWEFGNVHSGLIISAM